MSLAIHLHAVQTHFVLNEMAQVLAPVCQNTTEIPTLDVDQNVCKIPIVIDQRLVSIINAKILALEFVAETLNVEYKITHLCVSA